MMLNKKIYVAVAVFLFSTSATSAEGILESCRRVFLGHEIAAPPQAPQPSQSDLVQDRLQRSRFNVYRGLTEYDTNLSNVREQTSWLQHIKSKVGPGFRWVDLGAGIAGAQRQFIRELRREGSLQNLPANSLVALSYDAPAAGRSQILDAVQSFGNYFRFIETGFMETWFGHRGMSPHRDAVALYGTVSDITDEYGWGSYTDDVEGYIKTVADLLAVGGEARVHLRFASIFLTVDGRTETFRELPTWIEVFSGGRLQARFHNNGRLLHIVKVKDDASPIGFTSQTIVEEDGAPPSRRMIIRRRQ